MKNIKIGMFGLGTVGAGVVELLRTNQESIEKRAHACFEVAEVVVKNLDKKREVKVPCISDDPDQIFKRDDLDVIIELIGEKSLTQKIFQHCHDKKIPLITANKAFLSEETEFLKDINLPYLGYDASVAGSVPILKTIKYGFNANEIESIVGIINGTANFILSNMDRKGTPFEEELGEAQALGYAEADPTFDIKGQDTAHKLTILMGMAWQKSFSFSELEIEGIDKLDPSDLQYANEFGYKIKLLGIAKKSIDNQGKVCYEGRVHPTLVPAESMMASVNEAYNAIALEGNFAGPFLAYGKGAGSHPTASSVVSDLIDLAHHLPQPSSSESSSSEVYYFNQVLASLKSIDEIETEFFLHFKIKDTTGVLAEITHILSQENISISKVIQRELNEEHIHDNPNIVNLIIITHSAKEANIVKAIAQVDKQSFTTQNTKWLRIESSLH